jgi:CDP-diacylglycerol--glycerol-3-phosphate 3-phosphatidyltransferase
MSISMLDKKQIPNALCIVRIVLILPILYVLLSPALAKQWILILFLIAAFTDFLDGFLARKWDARTNLGAMLDQISDKLLLAVVLIMLAVHGITGVITVLVIILREIYVSGLREHMALNAIAVPVSKLGKAKTAVQMIAVGIILAGLTLQMPLFWPFSNALSGSQQAVVTGNYLLIVGALLGIISAVQYTLALRKKS